MDYVIVEVGGGQYKLKTGDVFKADFAEADIKKPVKLTKVLFCHMGKKIDLGTPYVKGASVTCEISKIGRGQKVIAYKYKKRKSSKFKKGHRQQFIELKVKEISVT